MIKALLLAALAVTPFSARAANGFMGHYGYLLTIPDGFSSKPAFHGAIEVADIYPEACAGLKSKAACAKIGMIDLAVMPIRMVDQDVGKKGFDAYIATVTDAAKEAGIKAFVKRGKRAGFPSVIIAMPGHPQPLNTMILIRGSKVYYRLKYNDKAGAKTAAGIADSLKEIAPHDNPPEPGAQ